MTLQTLTKSTQPVGLFSILFQRCIREMGSTKQVATIGEHALFVAEKAFAAACIKRNFLTEECLQYSSSLGCLRLLTNSFTKGIRCMFHPDCPAWFKNVVRACFKHVTSPSIERLRRLEARHEEALSKDLGEGFDGAVPAPLPSSGSAGANTIPAAPAVRSPQPAAGGSFNFGSSPSPFGLESSLRNVAADFKAGMPSSSDFASRMMQSIRDHSEV